MAQLRVTVGQELSLVFTCANYAKVRERALQFVGDAGKLKAKCVSSHPLATLEFCPDEDAAQPVWTARSWDADLEAFFFDNTVYNVYAELPDTRQFQNLRVKSRFAADEGPKKFARLGAKGSIRSGVLNFENDVGKFEFALQYDGTDGLTRLFTFSSEVLSQKLDARDDRKTMLLDVEKRYAMLAADYLRQTFYSFDRTRESQDTPELIWWFLFEAERKTFFKAIRTILERPRHRLRNVEEFVRADQLRKLTPAIENQFGEFRRDVGHLYRVEYDSHSHDTPENRFVKYAVETIGKKYAKLKAMICSESHYGKRLSDSAKAEMEAIEKSFAKTLAHPFFKGIGRFNGLRQMSLTLQNAPGYATVARTYAVLNASYMLFDGLKRLETKSIADLYEIWCFLKVEDIVKAACKRQFGELFREPKANHGELSGAFVRQLGTGTSSEVVFSIGEGREAVELARVVYNPKISDEERKNNGLPDTVVPTGLTGAKAQIPDIVLQLSRSSMNREEPFRLTYLFDAKYRIEDSDGDGENQTMRPPQDAIDQMHRYRDAIYYAERDKQKSLVPSDLKREVIGGYVLFPGLCKPGVQVDLPSGDDDYPPFFRSIHQVNIGAIPLRPNNGNEYGHLVRFISRLIAENPTLEAALDRINPQHGFVLDDSTQEGVGAAFLCGTYKTGQKDWMKERAREKKPVYYHLPKSTAEKTGIFSFEDAKRKKVLVLLSAKGYLEVSAPYKIETCEDVTLEALKAKDSYFADSSHPEGYYLFTVKPLIEPMGDVARRLKIVTLQKPGVCSGVALAANAAGLDIDFVADEQSALRATDGVAVLDTTGVVDHAMKRVLDGARQLRKSHQTIAMDMRLKKTRKVMVRWLRILLAQVRQRQYVLYLDGRTVDPNHDLESLACTLMTDVLKAI